MQKFCHERSILAARYAGSCRQQASSAEILPVTEKKIPSVGFLWEESFCNIGNMQDQDETREEMIVEYKLDSHTHTLASGHAYNTVLEMVQAASDRGLELLAITEHAMALPGTCHELYFRNLKVLPRQIKGIEVLFGVEVNLMDYEGKLDMKASLLRQMDVTIASMHIPCMAPGTVNQNTQAVVKAIENPDVNIIGHPDDGRYPVDFDTITAAAKEHHVLLELNNNSLNENCTRENALENDIKMLELCMKYKTPIIMNSDAHWAGDVGNCCNSLSLVEKMGFPEELIVSRSVEEYKKYVNRFKNK